MVALFPVTFPIAFCLDLVLGEEISTTCAHALGEGGPGSGQGVRCVRASEWEGEAVFVGVGGG
eukprot:3772016-Pleurochrysis_carterae.AAC.1